MNPADILDFLKTSPEPLTKREIARAFGIKGGEKRVALKQILKKLEQDGAVVKHTGGTFGVALGLPAVGIVEITDIDIDGDVLARALDWNEAAQGKPPRIEMMPEKKGHPALIIGDRALASFHRVRDDLYEARTIRRLDSEKGRVMGLVQRIKHGYVLHPTDKKAKYDFSIPHGEQGSAQEGDLAIGEIQPARGAHQKTVCIVEVLGSSDDPKSISLISLHEAGLKDSFPDSVTKATKGMSVPPLEKREDLRDIPLVTIDGADARDFDDAVFAEAVTLADGQKGFHLIVAIADVSFYVRHETPLDQEAQRRGNSTYFPDRVVPMLPEALSNDLCSLRPDEDRAALAAHLWIDEKGALVKYKFTRALIRSHARLIYEEVQAMFEKKDTPERTQFKHIHLIDNIDTLYIVFNVLNAARAQRGALDLDLPERQILLNDKNEMIGVKTRTRLDSHRLIEEFMVLANVAAATALEAKRTPCVYRIHDRPSADKLDSAREFIESFGLSLPKGDTISPAKINHILKKAVEMPYSHLISQVILRTQSQAVYSPQNIGHFGLALQRYGHFTSPIRRYADLIVHRALVSAYGMAGGGGLSDDEMAQLDSICAHISATERTSMEAERNATDRFTAAFLSTQIGATFTGRISGVTRFGLFVTLLDNGADGIVPMKSLSDDFYVHDETAHALIGRRRGKVFRLGGEVTVTLKEADGLTGSTVLELTRASLQSGADIPGMAKPKISSGSSDGGGRGRSKNFKEREKPPSGKPKSNKKYPLKPKPKSKSNKKKVEY